MVVTSVFEYFTPLLSPYIDVIEPSPNSTDRTTAVPETDELALVVWYPRVIAPATALVRSGKALTSL